MTTTDPISTAIRPLNAVRDAQSPEHYDVLKAEALCDAILALAEEQRTTNLIALAAAGPSGTFRHELLRRAAARIDRSEAAL